MAYLEQPRTDVEEMIVNQLLEKLPELDFESFISQFDPLFAYFEDSFGVVNPSQVLRSLEDKVRKAFRDGARQGLYHFLRLENKEDFKIREVNVSDYNLEENLQDIELKRYQERNTVESIGLIIVSAYNHGANAAVKIFVHYIIIREYQKHIGIAN